MSYLIAAKNLNEYLASRGFTMEKGEYKNEKSKCLFRCQKCSQEFWKTVSALKRCKGCRMCPKTCKSTAKLAELLRGVGFQFIGSYERGKSHKVIISKFNTNYNISLSKAFKLIGISPWEFYGIEKLYAVGTSNRCDRMKWKCLHEGKELTLSLRQITDRFWSS